MVLRVICLAGVSLILQAQQTPVCSSAAGSGATTATYNPLGVTSKSPTVAPPPFTQPAQPTVSAAQYQAYKSALLPYAQSSFVFPPRLDVTPAQPPVLAPAAAAPAPAPTYSWQGIPFTGQQPPSPDFAAGPSDVLMVANSAIAQFTRSGTLVKQVAFSDWFAPLIPTICPSGLGACLLFDPVVRYDQLHGRFLFLATARDFNARQGWVMLSVSNGATFNSGWRIWAMDIRVNGAVSTDTFGDYWRVGFDNSAIYLAGNLFGQGSGAFQYGKIRILKKSELYNPATMNLTFTDFWNCQNADGTTASSIAPAHERGALSPVTGDVLVNASDKPPASYLTVWQFTNPVSATPTITRSTISNLLPYYFPTPAPQKGTPATLDSGDTRILKAVYRSGFLYTARDSGYTDATTTSTFDVINTSSMTATAQARLVSGNIFYPAFDVSAATPAGAPVATNSLVFGTTTNPSDGTLTYAGIGGLSFTLKAGEGPFNFAAGGVSRWGDYFGGAVDPVGGGLWTSGEYAQAPVQNNPAVWGTWAGYFPWVTTPAFSDVDPAAFYADYINVMNTWQITTGCGTNPPTFCPANPVQRAQLATFIIRSMFGNTFPYTTTPYFTDVPASSPFFPYVQKLRDLGITTGCGNGTTFCPSDTVTRWQAAVLIVRAKLGSLFGNNFTYPTTAFFSDVPSTDPGFPYVQKLAELGVTSGCGTGTTFCPGDQITRWQAAVFITRAFLN